jgi:hypothetical protein
LQSQQRQFAGRGAERDGAERGKEKQ